MNKRIEELLEKYWNADSTLEEEAELRDLIAQADGHESEKEWFLSIQDFASEEPERLEIPRWKKKAGFSWLGWAASVLILVGSYAGWQAYERQQEEEAYREVAAALSLIQDKFSEGQSQLEKMNELRYLNTTNSLFENQEK
ncbi:hypothetical protein E4S40_14830 [Algoriphagus kandeliae]|uniref:Uncharacterized protein n=1 Tax=Algoriphagus kandeliae TaxID=2562278 RepID=A0A4Y9QLG8_9BACT|nr:hypothetical protein [Algoriphagus kandeliae]TFV93519.1 hypothetical protein E4S40_14830 [Algoriphagus kandeliae]